MEVAPNTEKEANLDALMKEVDSVKKALADEKERSSNYLNQLKYLQADLENFQKRMKKEKDEIIERANERLISQLLVVLDDMEIAMNASSEIDNSQTIKSGFKSIFDKLRELLKIEGLVRIEAIGKQFDPSIHEATDQALRYDVPDGSIVDEIQAGYIYKGRLLRPSIVVVTKSTKESDSLNLEKRNK